MQRLNDKVALVTGASKGIGAAIAKELAKEGASVVVNYASSRAGADRVVAEIEKLGGKAAAVQGDVAKESDVERLFAETRQVFGRLDILVNNAGIGAFEPVADMTAATWDAVIETNLNGVFYCTHEAMPHLKAANGGWVINIGSLAGKNAFPRGAVYNASKFGLIGFSEALMQEVRYDDIRVSYIMPGSVATEFGGRDESEGADWRIASEDVARAVMDVLSYPGRSLASRIELRPSKPPKRN
jgi:NAD(P)-dependent dehydrogenase (short-subunit alcohol dehydrogenase family)